MVEGNGRLDRIIVAVDCFDFDERGTKRPIQQVTVTFTASGRCLYDLDSSSTVLRVWYIFFSWCDKICHILDSLYKTEEQAIWLDSI